jgi:hypothetical protein
MYPLVYHLGIDDYFPNEDFEPHLFQRRAAARREARRPSVIRRAFTALVHAAGLARRPSDAVCRPQPSARASRPAIRWS